MTCHLFSQDSDEDTEAANHSKRRVVKRKRKSYRSDGPSDSDSEEDENSRHHQLQTTEIPDLDEVEASLELQEQTGGDITEQVLLVEEEEEEKELYWENLYQGKNDSYQARNLEPATVYLFRVSAINSAGASVWSEPVEVMTPPAPPAPVGEIRLRDSSAKWLAIEWSRPQSNGDHITHYNVDTGYAVLRTAGPDTNFVVNDLM